MVVLYGTLEACLCSVLSCVGPLAILCVLVLLHEASDRRQPESSRPYPPGRQERKQAVCWLSSWLGCTRDVEPEKHPESV